MSVMRVTRTTKATVRATRPTRAMDSNPTTTATSHAMGFGTQRGNEPPPAPKPCTHQGMFIFRDIGSGMAVRYCEGCGMTHTLLQNGNGAFLLVEVPEYGVEKWDEVALLEGTHEDEIPDDVAAALLAGASADTAQTSATGGITEGEAEDEDEADGDDGADERDGAIRADVEQALSEVSDDEAEQPVPPRPRRSRRKTRGLQDLQTRDQCGPDAEAAS